jgi:hypothetical protein
MILYLDGQEKKGLRTAEEALAANDPAAVVDFLNSLDGLRERSSAEPFLGRLRHLTGTLGSGVPVSSKKQGADSSKSAKTDGKKRPAESDSDGYEALASESRGVEGDVPGAPSEPTEPNVGPTADTPRETDDGRAAGRRAAADLDVKATPILVGTPDTDASRIVTQTVSPANHPSAKPCGTLSPNGGQCLLVIQGPAVLTDVSGPAGCPLFVAVGDAMGDPGAPKWVVRAPIELHGARFAVPAGYGMYVGILTSEPACSITWSAIKGGSSRAKPSRL